MQINFNDKVYTLDLEEITVHEQRTIQKYAGFTLRDLEAALKEGDIEALTCLYWLMLKQSGEEEPIESVDFKLIKFVEDLASATEEGRKALKDLRKPGKAKPAATA